MAGGGGAATEEQFKSRIKTFPNGVIIAEYEKKIVGVVVGQIVDSDYISRDKLSWASITDTGTIRRSHKPDGDVLFGVDLSVDPDYRNEGVGGKLLLEIGRLAVRLNLKCGILGARMPDYCKYYKAISPEDYINYRDGSGKLVDSELRFYENNGAKPLRVIKDYFPDKESLDYGVMCVWNNPFYINSKQLGKPIGLLASYLFRI